MVMPRSRSRSIESRTCSIISRCERAPVTSRSRSARVDLPWSMCAMIEKLRMKLRSMRCEGSPELNYPTGRLKAAKELVYSDRELGKQIAGEGLARSCHSHTVCIVNSDLADFSRNQP